MRAIASGEWLHAASHAAVLLDRQGAVALRELLTEVPHRTPWVDAALRSVTGAVAGADGDRDRAADLHLAAADIYGDIPNRTDRALALAAAVRAAPDRTDLVAELREFARRNAVPGLLALAGLLSAAAAVARFRGLRLRGGGRVLRLLGVDVDVLAAGQLHQLVHDLVGDRALDEPVAGHALRSGRSPAAGRTGSSPASGWG